MATVDDDEDEVVVLVELGPLGELFGVLDREWMELEYVSQDLEVVVGRPIEIEPEEVPGREQPLGRAAVKADLVAVSTARRRNRPKHPSGLASPLRPPA